MTGNDKQNVIDRLKSYNKRFDDLLALLENLPLHGNDKTNAQQMLKTLKELLKSDYKDGDTNRGRQRMTEIEKHYFHPAVHEAYAAIRVRWNTIPTGQWFSELYSAQINITHMLHQLEK